MSEPFAQYPYGQYGQNPAPEPPKRHRGRTMLGLTATAIVAAGAGAGAAVGLSHRSTPGGSATSTSKEVLSTSQIANLVNPGILDVTSPLAFQNPTPNATGILLTSNVDIITT